MQNIPECIVAYYVAGLPLVCELDLQPWSCEFWPLDELETYNREYQVHVYAPGYFGFATSGGGEMFALSPESTVVYLPFIGMEPATARQLASSWSSFTPMLRNAL